MTIEQKVAGIKSWDKATLRVNNQIVPPGEQVMLIRGGANTISVEAPPEIAQRLRLYMPDSGGLNVVSSPLFGSWVDGINGLFEWTLTPDDGLSGLVTLVFLSLEVLQPWEHIVAVMSDDVADEVDVIWVRRISNPNPDPVPAPLVPGYLFFRTEVVAVTLTYKAGSPLANLNWNLQLVGTVKSGTPILAVTPTLPTHPHSWQVNANTRSGTFELELKGPGFIKNVVVLCSVMSRYLTAEADVRIEGVSVPAGGNFFFRGKPLVVTLVPKTDSPLGQHRVWLECRTDAPLSPADVSCEPEFGDPQTTHEWRVTGRNRSGTFRLRLVGQDMTVPIDVPQSKLVSDKLYDEVDVLFDGVPHPPTEIVDFEVGKSQEITLQPKLNSPVAGARIWMAIGNTPAVLECTPELNTEQTVHRWDVKGKSGAGDFQPAFLGPGFDRAAYAPVCRLLSGPVSAYFDVLFDGKPLPDGQKPMLTRYGLHTFTLKPKSGMAIPGRVGLRWGTPPIGVKMDPDNAVPQDVHPVDGVTWTLRCLNVDGEFSVRTEAQWASEQLEIPMSVSAGEYKLTFSLYGSPMPYPPAVVPALSANPKEWPRATPRITVTTLTGVPVPGVWVTFVSPDYADGHGQSDHLGSALSSQVVQYFKEGIVELVAKVTGTTGRVSMMRILIDHIYRP